MTISELIDLPENRPFDGEYAVSGIKKKPFAAKDGYFLSFNLNDVTGSIEALIWEAENVIVEEDTVVYVKGKTSTYRGKSQVVITHIEPRTVFDKAMFIAKSKRDFNEMIVDLKNIISAIRDISIKKLLLSYVNDRDFMAMFVECPGGKGKNVHHAYINGLLEHTLFTMKLASAYSDFYKINKDITVAGAFLHDLGKMESYSYRITIQMTDVGRLHDHPALGYSSFVEKLNVCEIDKEEKVRLKMELGHIILSHHGDKGMIKPMTVEAILVSKADSTDADAAATIALMDDSEEGWEWDNMKDQYFFKNKDVAPIVEEELPKKKSKIMGRVSKLFNY